MLTSIAGTHSLVMRNLKAGVAPASVLKLNMRVLCKTYKLIGSNTFAINLQVTGRTTSLTFYNKTRNKKLGATPLQVNHSLNQPLDFCHISPSGLTRKQTISVQLFNNSTQKLSCCGFVH